MPDAAAPCDAAEPENTAGRDAAARAAARAAAEEESAFSHAPVEPDGTAAYGDHPDQVIDFYAPRDTGSSAPATAPLVVVLHGGAWRAPYDRRHITPFVDFLARRGFAVANVEYRRGGAAPAGEGEAAVAGRWPDTFEDVSAALDALTALVREALTQS
ncbi:alpha/beta hydrolase, partial [Streptomyces carpinensis]